MAKKIYKLTPDDIKSLYQIAKNLPVFPKMKDGKPKIVTRISSGEDLIKAGVKEINGQPVWPHEHYSREEVLMENPMTHLRRAAEKRQDILKAREAYLELYKEYKTTYLANAKNTST